MAVDALDVDLAAAASLAFCKRCAAGVPHGGLFVYTHRLSINALSTAYGPHANDAAFDVTAVELDA